VCFLLKGDTLLPIEIIYCANTLYAAKPYKLLKFNPKSLYRRKFP